MKRQPQEIVKNEYFISVAMKSESLFLSNVLGRGMLPQIFPFDTMVSLWWTLAATTVALLMTTEQEHCVSLLLKLSTGICFKEERKWLKPFYPLWRWGCWKETQTHSFRWIFLGTKVLPPFLCKDRWELHQQPVSDQHWGKWHSHSILQQF